MIVSKINKFVFVSTPKTGTHSMFKLLPELFETFTVEGAYHETNVPDEYKDFFIFTTVRNPFERMVSIWNALINLEEYRVRYLPIVGGESFSDFVHWITKQTKESRPKGRGAAVLTTQSEWLEGIRVDQYLKLENIDKEIQTLPFYSNAKEQPFERVPKVLARKHVVWNDLKNDELRSLIVNWANKDFENFNYDKNY
jgi:hypothetical protein